MSEVLAQVWASDPNDWICGEGRPYVAQRLPVTPRERLSIKFNKGNGGHHSNDKGNGKGGESGGRKIGHYQAVVSRGSHNLIAIGEPDDATPSQCIPGGKDKGLAIFTWNEPV